MQMKVSTSVRDWVQPLFRRPKGLQVAALCHRETKGATQVLLITSRGTGRWVMPKGWLIRGLSAAEAAVQEAWEEAGVQDALCDTRSIGRYRYDKIMDDGLPLPIETAVFAIKVGGLADAFPERDERQRKWVTPKKAATLVDEPELKSILRTWAAKTTISAS